MTTNMEDFKNLYEVKKTVRFELRPMSEKAKDLSTGGVSRITSEPSMETFLNFLENFRHQLMGTIFVEAQNGSMRFVPSVVVKYQWLRSYTKQDFYDFTATVSKSVFSKKYHLYDVPYLKKALDGWSDEWGGVIDGIREIQALPLHTQKRKSDYASKISTLKQRQVFEFIREFVQSISDKDSSDRIDALQALIKTLGDALVEMEKFYLPSQSRGLQVAKGTFNYYSLNKSNKLRGQEDGESDERFVVRLEKGLSDQCRAPLKEVEGYFPKENVNGWSLKEAYEKLKVYKSETKKRFGEVAQKNNATAQSLKREFPLFDATDDALNEFIQQTRKIERLANDIKEEKDPCRKEELWEKMHTLKQQRGHFFNDPNNRDKDNRPIIITHKYNAYCFKFKDVAREFGSLNARIAGVKTELKESQQLGYWCVITEYEDTRTLLMFPRRTYKDARQEINTLASQENGATSVYTFNSLTFRALWKLCFKKEGNTFFYPVARELHLPLEYTNIKGLQHKHAPYFYQRVLKSNSARQQLDLVDFGGLEKNVINHSFRSMDEFERALEQNCYIKKTVHITRQQKEALVAKYDALEYEITSQDLTIRQRNSPNAAIHKYKDHSLAWFSFWSESNAAKKYITRLNPEVRIFWRESQREAEANRQHRFSREHFTLATTITLNATQNKMQLEFKDTKTIKKHVDEYNEAFRHRFNGSWYYGVDRGTKELATLCVMQPTEEVVRVNGQSYKKPKFAEIEVCAIKDIASKADIILQDGINKRRQEVIKNPSYFVGKEQYKDLFEVRTIPCVFDMSAAKLIKKHIVLNGDLITYFKLKECSARRRLHILFRAGKINNESPIREKNGKLWVTTSGGEVEVYWKTDHDDGTYLQKAKDALQVVINNLSVESLSDEIEEINRLRNAITANMTGIIAFLQTKFEGSISLENFSRLEHYDKHAAQSEENISRQLEWMFYRKFQSNGMVPPEIRQPMLLREEFKHEQFGAILFVETAGTSKTCPRCQKEKEGKKGDNCRECGFSFANGADDKRLGFEALDNSDKAAAYNIAKRGLEFILKKADTK